MKNQHFYLVHILLLLIPILIYADNRFISSSILYNNLYKNSEYSINHCILSLQSRVSDSVILGKNKIDYNAHDLDSKIRLTQSYYYFLFQKKWNKVYVDIDLKLYEPYINDYSLSNFLTFYLETRVLTLGDIYVKKISGAYTLDIDALNNYLLTSSLLSNGYHSGFKFRYFKPYELHYELRTQRVSNIKDHADHKLSLNGSIKNYIVSMIREKGDLFDFTAHYRHDSGNADVTISHNHDTEKLEGAFTISRYFYQIQKPLTFWNDFSILYNYDSYYLKDLDASYNGDSPWPFGFFDYYGYKLNKAHIRISSYGFQKSTFFSWDILVKASRIESDGLIKEYVTALIFPALKTETSLASSAIVLSIDLKNRYYINKSLAMDFFIQQIVPLRFQLENQDTNSSSSSNNKENNQFAWGGLTLKTSLHWQF